MPNFFAIRQALLDSAPNNLEIFDLALEMGQEHLFENWIPVQIGASHLKLLNQLSDCNSQYLGGLKAYVSNAKRLLMASKRGDNPYEGFIPKVPDGIDLRFGDSLFRQMENLGLKRSSRTGFVLVAGGLGERLGYSGIKIALPSETVTGKSFIQLYIETLLAFQKKANAMLAEQRQIPLAIMTSGDTHDETEALLKKHGNFGMASDQIILMKQEKVPSLADNQAHFVLQADDPFCLETKPHGHGDVHALLHQKGIVKAWLERGIEWMTFFQDTNGVVFKAILPALGVSVTQDFEVNTITVARKAGEAAGGIVRLEKPSGEGMTINVEYNQLDPLLRANGQPDGDMPDDSGFSPYPGNTNVLIFKLQPYVENIQRSGGMIPEFVNPKYSDADKEHFKKPTRLECMMQDYPKLLSAGAKVGFTNFERWLSFSAVKNNLADAVDKAKHGLPPECASSGEMDIYHVHREYLKQCGAMIETKEEVLAGIALTVGPQIVLSPNFACSLDEMREKIQGLEVAANSTLIVDGDMVKIKGLKVDGALEVWAREGESLTIEELEVVNQGWGLVEITDAETVSEELAIRGFKIVKKETRVIKN